MPELCKIPSLEICQKRFLWTCKEVDLAWHSVVGLVLPVVGLVLPVVGLVHPVVGLVLPVVGLVLQGGSAETSSGTWFENPDPFFQSTRTMEMTRDLDNLNLVAMPMVLLRLLLFTLAIAAIAAAILIRISAEQVPSLYRVAAGT